MKPPSFSHLMPVFFLNHANAFLILTEESGNRPVFSITPASPILRSLTVLYILALLSTGIACPPLYSDLFRLCNDYVISFMIISVSVYYKAVSIWKQIKR